MEPTRITLVPHTHWDREWYRPFEEFRERLVAMMDTLIDLGNGGFPHFHLDGQTAMIDDYLAVRPERERDVKRLAAEGRLSVGPWVTQMDEFLVSGESHIRNLEMGLRRARQLGPALEVGYLPDQFGHIGQMPQILRMFGIDRAVVWRGVPASIDRTAFQWESPEGSRVLTEYLAFGYFLGGMLTGLEGSERLAQALGETVAKMRPYLVDERMLVMVGSDHSGPDAALPERLAGANRLDPGPGASIGSLDRHLDGRRVDEAPTWRGELRSSARAHLLPNVFSARAPQKSERGRVEALLERYAEPLAALVPGFEWPQEAFDRAWTLLLWNGAHDSACGCSHDQVARDVDARFEEARGLCDVVIDRALESLGSQVAHPGVLRFNPSPFDREGVPGLGWRVDPEAAERAEVPLEIRDGRDGELLADGIEILLLDEPDVGDLYNYCYETEGQVPWAPAENRIEGQTVTARFDDELQVRLRIRRFSDESFLRIEGVIDNRRPDHRLRLHVGLSGEANGALAGSPFELVQRGLVSEGGEHEAPSPTWPARHVVMAGGIGVLHEGVFEYEVVGGRQLAVTLLRCVGTISRKELATRPFAAGPDVPTPDAQMIGETTFTLGVLADPRREDLLGNWERFALPVVSARASGGGARSPSGQLLRIEGAELSSIRRRDGAVEVRLWNPWSDRPVEAAASGRAMTLHPAQIRTLRL